MTRKKHPPIQRDWIAKTLAGAILGFTLALACSGLFAQLQPNMPLPIKGQLAMWMVAPIWLGAFGSVYFFRSGWQAWFWLGAANALAVGALAMARLLGATHAI